MDPVGEAGRRVGSRYERKHERVAIVGFCQPHRDWVPYEESDLEIWGLNRGYVFMERADRWFEMHGPAIQEWQQRRPGNHLQFLRNFAGPIYMHQARPDVIPNAVDYPLQAVAEDLGPLIEWFDQKGHTHWGTERPYLSSTVAQEVALAIHMGFREIGLYGIDLNTKSEYAWQKPGVEHFLGVALGRGIKIRLPEKCPLLQGAIYGRGYLSPRGEIVSPEQWMERITALTEEKRVIETQLNQTLGGHKELVYLLEQMIPGMDHEAMDHRRQQFERARDEMHARLLQTLGKLEETLYWAHQTPAGQDPEEALGQLVAAAGAMDLAQSPNGQSESIINYLAVQRLESGVFVPDEGPTEDGITAGLMDVASGPVGAAISNGLVHDPREVPGEFVPDEGPAEDGITAGLMDVASGPVGAAISNGLVHDPAEVPA